MKPGILRSRNTPHEAIVLSENDKKAEVVNRDGSVDAVRLDRLEIIQAPPGGDNVSEAAQLLAACGFHGIGPGTQGILLARAVEHSHWSIAAWRRLVRDGIALGVPEVIDQITMSASERLWWRSLATWKTGDVEATAHALEELPEGMYPAQIAIWWHLLAQSGDSGEFLTRIIRAVRPIAASGEFDPPGIPAVVLNLLRRRYFQLPGPVDLPESHTERATATEEACTELTRDVAVLGQWACGGKTRHEHEHERPSWRALSERQRGADGDTPEARLVSAWHALVPADSESDAGTTSPAQRSQVAERLGDDPAILDAAPLCVLDDLLDAQVVPSAWLQRADELRCGDYLIARTDISAAGDAALVRFGADREIARRAVANGDPVPPHLAASEDETRALVAMAALADDPVGDELADRLALPEDMRGHLAAAFDDPTSLPHRDLLGDRLLATILSHRSELSADALPERGHELDPTECLWASRVLLRQAKEALHEWSWTGALDRARECLRIAREEPQRDEALNLLAAAHWELGNHQEAIKALLIALEGEYTSSLQANIAVVAAEFEPQVAAVHLARLVDEAPDLALRVSAARQAQLIWSGNRQLWVESDRLPDELAGALRGLLVEPVPEDAFREIVQILAQHDRDWLADPSNLARSPHGGSPAAQIWGGYARSMTEMVDALAAALEKQAEPWMERLRDDLMATALENLVAPGPGEAAVGMGLALLKGGLPAPPVQLILLRALTVLKAAQVVTGTATSEPVPELLDWLEAARHDLDKLARDDRRRGESAVNMAYDALAGAYTVSRLSQISEVGQVIDQVQAQLRGVSPLAVNRWALQTALHPAIQVCHGTIGLMDRLVPYVSPDLAAVLTDVIRGPAARHLNAMNRLLNR